MIVQKLVVGGLLCAASLLIAAPAAQAGTGSASSGSASVNLGCILASLSGGGKTADCHPVVIPTSEIDDGSVELPLG